MFVQQPVKAVLLDLDGTLSDSLKIHTEAWTRMLKKHLGIILRPGELRPFIGTPAIVILREYAPDDQIPVLMEALVSYEVQLSDQIQLFPEIRPALKELHSAGLKLAVVTSQTDAECDLARQSLDLEEVIDLWVTSSMVATPKPDPAPVLKAIEIFKIKPGEVIMIGDTFNDLEAGRNAGVRIGAVLWGFGQRDKLLSYHPDFVFEHPGELLDLKKLVNGHKQ